MPHNAQLVRGVAQPGSALAWGARGREFESRRPDHNSRKETFVASPFLLSSSTPSLLHRAFSLIDCFVASFCRLSHIVCCSIFLVPMKVVFFGTNGKIPFNSRIFWYQKLSLLFRKRF